MLHRPEAFPLCSGSRRARSLLAWATASACLALAAAGLREPRFQLAGLALAALAAAETVAELARPHELFRAGLAPADGVVALAATVGALLALGVLARVGREDPDTLDATVEAAQERARRWLIGSAAALALYAVSLSVLGISVELGGGDLAGRFQRGHTVVSALWGLVGLVALSAGLRRTLRALRRAGILLLLAALAKLFVYDLSSLSSIARALSFLAVGGLLLLAGFVYQRIAAEVDARNGRPAH